MMTADVCRTNLISSLQTILDNMLLLSVSLSDPTLKESANLIISLENEFGSVGVDEGTGELLPGVLDACIALWADPNVKHTALERSHEFQLNDSAAYFLDEAHRIGQPGWKPNDMDILKARVKTTGISETRFTKGGRNFTVVDVGGQRSERRKWLNCFVRSRRLMHMAPQHELMNHLYVFQDSVTSLLYVVALNEYNMMLREDESVVSASSYPPVQLSSRLCIALTLPVLPAKTEPPARSPRPIPQHHHLHLLPRDPRHSLPQQSRPATPQMPLRRQCPTHHCLLSRIRNRTKSRWKRGGPGGLETGFQIH